MNVHEYISTGILEAYALGDLAEAERAEVEKNLVQYPALREELSRIELVQETLSMHAAITPRPAVKDALFANVEAWKPEARTVNMPDMRNTFWRLAAAASITLAVVTSYLAYHYYRNWQAAQTNLTELIAQNQRMAQDYNQVNERLEKIGRDLQVVDNTAFTRVALAGTPQAPNAMAYVYWNARTREVYLRVENLKTLARENQYQLWAIVDGKPVDAGVFDGGQTEGLLKMKDVNGAAATFAVTVEPRGGKPAPTLETMQVAGNVPKG